MAERIEPGLSGETVADVIYKFSKFKTDFYRMLSEVRKSRPLSVLGLKKTITRQGYLTLDNGKMIRPSTGKRQLHVPSFLRVDF